MKIEKELNHKKHIILPNNLKIQLKNKDGKNIEQENILCHLNIYIDSTSYYTYSFIPTNSNGIVNLTKEQIVQNTELKHYYDESLPLDFRPVKFDFFVMDKAMIDNLIFTMKNYLDQDIESIKYNLKNNGFTEEQIQKQVVLIEEKLELDKKLYELLKKNNNKELDYSQGEIKLTSFWKEKSNYQYNLN